MIKEQLTSKGASTRDRILREARRALVTSGFQGLVLREVAEACAMKLGNLQYYFPTVDDLLLAVIEAEAQKDRELISRARAGADDPEHALRALVVELVTRWRGDAATIYATLTLLSQHSRSYRRLYSRIYDGHYAALEALIGAACPGLAEAECATRARLTTALIDGAPFQTRVGRKSDFLARVVDQACELALAPTG